MENSELKFLIGGGEMGERIRTFDWSQTPLGPIEAWPQSLKTSTGLMLNSQHPMWVGWGPEATFLYNDAYIQVLSLAKHPGALGKPTAQVWAEIWDICGPLADKVFQRGEASFVNDVRLFMNRGDFLEETFYSFSYSPIRDETGDVGGLFCPSSEVTAKILSTRRLRTLSELAAESMVEKSTQGACASAAAILGKNSDDIPFALLYLIDWEECSAFLAQAVGLAKGNPLISPESVELTIYAGEQRFWPIAEVAITSKAQMVSLREIAGFPLGAAEQPISEAIVLRWFRVVRSARWESWWLASIRPGSSIPNTAHFTNWSADILLRRFKMPVPLKKKKDELICWPNWTGRRRLSSVMSVTSCEPR